MIRILDNTDQAKIAFQKLFSSTDPFDPAGRTEFSVRAVLFPTDSYHLDSEQFEALIRAARNGHESNFFISEMESSDPFDLNARWKRKHWLCTDPTFEEYSSLMIGVDNALYSTSGSWGVLLSHELHGLLVCQEPFWRGFANNYPNWKDDLGEFVSYWDRIRGEAGTETKWLDPFITNLTQPR